MNSTVAKPSEEAVVNDLRERGLPALGDYLNENRSRLKRFVTARIDRRLSARLDESDIIQGTFLEASKRLDSFLENPEVSPFVWLRFMATQYAARIHRDHIKVQKQSAKAEVPGGDPAIENLMLDLSQAISSPHSQIVRRELQERVRAVLHELSDSDRELLTMVHLEELTVSEAAEVIGDSYDTVRKRHFRAMKRLKEVMFELETRFA